MEYTLSVLRCKKRALSTEEKALVGAAEGIDSKYPRPTSDEIEAFMEKLKAGPSEEEVADPAAKEAVSDLT